MVQAHEPRAIGDYYIGANVEIAPDVAIAAGVVLEAAPGAQLVIASGVCIGMGVIVQAAGGKLVLGAGVNLGSGVLIVGWGLVGPHACIGAESSLFNPQIAAGGVLTARSLHGIPGTDTDISAASNGQVASSAHPSNEPEAAEAANNGAAEPQSDEEGLAPSRIVYGREQLTQLMKTLFPHRDALNGNGQSPS